MSTLPALSSTESMCGDECAILRRGDHDALAEVFSQYRHRLEQMVAFRLDPRLLGRIDPADVVQEAYIEVARRMDDFLTGPAVSLFVWFRQITWQILLDVHRRHLGQKRNAGQEVSLHVSLHGGQPSSSSAFPLAQQLAGSFTSPSQAAIRNERMTLLRKAIAGMDAMDREILAMRHFEQLNNSEVAEVLGIKKTAASNRYVRALRRLRECLDATSALDEGEFT